MKGDTRSLDYGSLGLVVVAMHTKAKRERIAGS